VVQNKKNRLEAKLFWAFCYQLILIVLQINPVFSYEIANPQSKIVNQNMSSHHIIRDKQEPALIIANGESCSAELLGQLLEWSPFIIVLDGAIKRVLDLGIKIDVLLGDFDGVTSGRNEVDFDEIRAGQYPIEIVHTPDQNYTDLEKAFLFLIQRGHTAANIIWATGRRTDHTITNLTSIVRYKSKLQLVIIDDYSTIYPLLPTPNRFEKWFTKGTPLSLIPVGNASGIFTQNMLYPLENDTLMLGYRTGSSNEVAEDGIVKITYETGDLLLMECHD
jgi:thiamine pyrophosphokinase